MLGAFIFFRFFTYIAPFISDENEYFDSRIGMRELKGEDNPDLPVEGADNPDLPEKGADNPEQQQLAICSENSRWTGYIKNPEITTNWKTWTFKDTVNCPKFDISNYPKARHKVSLNCDKEPTMVTSVTTKTDSIFSVKFGDECLKRVIDNCCVGNKKVPNVVHYIWYSKRELGFFQFVSFMSALRFIKPCLFLIHGDYVPYGKFWDYFVSISPNIIHVQRDRPQTVFGKKLQYKEHSSDIMRIEGLKSKLLILSSYPVVFVCDVMITSAYS